MSCSPRPVSGACSGRASASGSGRSAAAGEPARAQLVGEPDGLRGRRHPEPAAQRRPQGLEDLGRRGAVAGAGEPRHQLARGVLGDRVELEPPPRVAERGGHPPVRLGALPRRAEQRDDALAMRVARDERPLVVEVGDELPVGQRERRLEVAGRGEPRRLADVDGDGGPVRDPDPLAAGVEHVGRGGGERPADGGQRGAQAAARAGLEHVGPEHRRDLRARVQALVVRQPREQ